MFSVLQMTKLELILGGQRSGKTQLAESRAIAWLDEPAHEACVVATATRSDDEMCKRIARHRDIRARTLPRATCIEEPRELASLIATQSQAHRLLLVDCLTLWATNLLAPELVGLEATPLDAAAWTQACHGLAEALKQARGPVVLVSGEISLGLRPAHGAALVFVDAMGELHQCLSSTCARVTWVVAGVAITVKD